MKQLVIALILLPLYTSAQPDVGVNARIPANGKDMYGACLGYTLSNIRFSAGDNIYLQSSVNTHITTNNYYGSIDYLWPVFYLGIDGGPAFTDTKTDYYNYFYSPANHTSYTDSKTLQWDIHLGPRIRIFKPLTLSAQLAYYWYNSDGLGGNLLFTLNLRYKLPFMKHAKNKNGNSTTQAK